VLELGCFDMRERGFEAILLFDEDNAKKPYRENKSLASIYQCVSTVYGGVYKNRKGKEEEKQTNDILDRIAWKAM